MKLTHLAINKSTLIKCAWMLGTAGVLTLSAVGQAAAAPLLSNTAALKAATAAAVIDVRWYYRYPSYGYVYAPYSYSYGYYGNAYGYTPYYSYAYVPYGYGYNSYAYIPWH